MDLTGHTGNGAASPDLTNTEANLSRTDAGGQEDIADITILGAGPTGLYGAFYAGMRELKTKIIDALPEPGGQLSALYPEKYIYDAPGYPKVVAKELVKQLYEQAIQWNPTIVLGERVLDLKHRDDGIIALRTDKQTHLTRSVVICAGVGAFSPNKIAAPGAEDFEGKCVHYFVKEKAAFAGKNLLIVGGGDSAVDWALNLHGTARHITLVHRRDEFRAHESSVNQLRASDVRILTPFEVKSIDGQDGMVEHVTVYNNKTKEEETLDVDAILVNIGFKADIGPIKEWGLALEKRGIVVNQRMESNLPGVFAAGDIAYEEVKMNLIATGYGQVALAVNVAKHYVDPKASIFPGHSSEKM